MTRIFLAWGTLFLALAAPALTAAPVSKAPREPVTNGYDPQEHTRHQQNLFDRLWSANIPLTAAAVTVTISDEEAEGLRGGKAGLPAISPLELRQRVGLVRSVSHQVDFDDFQADKLPRARTAAAGGALASHPGGMTWTAKVEAVDATAMRLRFSAVRLAPNASLYVYNEEGQVAGPYTAAESGAGSFWSGTIPGGTAYVQLEFDGQPSAEDLRRTGFVISGVGYIGPLYQVIAIWDSCRDNPGCVESLTGSTIPQNIAAASQAIAHLQFVSRGSIYICSGGLIADTDQTTETNYLLTANHCISQGGEAASLEAVFMYTQCGSGVPAPPSATPAGAQILASNRTGDYTLMLLNGAVPAGAVRLGWTETKVARSNGTSLFRISHPNGAPQSYSEHVVDTSRATCRSWPRGNWIYSSDTFGATTGGSSGSPVLNSDGDIVGQLSGACGYNVSDSCDAESNATVDGALAAYFDDVRAWLDPPPTSPGNQDPVADFTVTTDGLTAYFTDGSYDPDADGNIVSWLWDFGDPSTLDDTSTLANPTYTYPGAGTYNVSLTVTDNLGGTGNRTIPVTVSDGSVNSVVSVAAINGTAICDGRGGRWTASFDIQVTVAQSGATISGNWGGGAKGSGSCTTDGTGACSVDKKNLKQGGSVQFTVTDVQLAGYSFDGAGPTAEVAGCQ